MIWPLYYQGEHTEGLEVKLHESDTKVVDVKNFKPREDSFRYMAG
jgi:hypothetical protein